MPRPSFRKKEEIDSIIRVDHAGEYGAMRIYSGQLAASRDPRVRESITHMMNQEKKHLAFFEEEMKARRVRPTVLLPIWHYGAYALGFVTAKLGLKTAMLCTEAVEDVIDLHYQEQISSLATKKEEAALASKIEEYRLEELEHKNDAISMGSQESKLYHLGHAIISTMCKVAIGLSKRI